MESILLYLLKSGSVLALFLVSYQLFLKKETFFISNRIFLVIGLVSSFIMPLITFTRTILIEPQPSTKSNFYLSENAFKAAEIVQPFYWIGLLASIYALGVLFFSFRLFSQLRALQKIKNNADVIKQDKLTHVKTERQISPFSFFKYIFYNPQLFKRTDLRIILNHEKVHATQLHSLDVILSEIVLILQWFNPIIWLYRKSIKENLEFLADAYTCVDKEGKKHYQYLLLQKVIETNKVTIANPFFNSLIKKRIVMLNRNQSKKVNVLKLFIVLPLLMAFLMAFNIREEVKFSEPINSISGSKMETLDFQSPINQKDIKYVSAGFGLGKNKLDKDKFHNGIDLVATTGTKVMASNTGTVKASSQTPSMGNYIIIEHELGYSTKYMHLNNRSVKSGEQVQIGAEIGHLGNTGKSTGPHLHFEILQSDNPINPESLVAFKHSNHIIKKSNSGYIKKKTVLEKKVELTIDKDTSDKSLLKMKNDLGEQEVDFSYTIVRNEKKEIIDIFIQITGKNKNGGTFNSSYNSTDEEKAISPLVVLIDQEHNLISIRSKEDYKPNVLKIYKDYTNSFVDSGNEEHTEIHIKKANGKKIITVNGKKVDEEDLEDMDIHIKEGSKIFVTDGVKKDGKKIKIIKSDSNSKDHEKYISVYTNYNDDEHEVRIIEKKESEFIFIESGEDEPLIIIDGKETNTKAMKNLIPDNIESMNVLKDKKAKQKYGKKGKNGVIEITTKKN